MLFIVNFVIKQSKTGKTGKNGKQPGHQTKPPSAGMSEKKFHLLVYTKLFCGKRQSTRFEQTIQVSFVSRQT